MPKRLRKAERLVAKSPKLDESRNLANPELGGLVFVLSVVVKAVQKVTGQACQNGPPPTPFSFPAPASPTLVSVASSTPGASRSRHSQ